MTAKVLHIINDLSLNGGAQRFVIDLVCPPPDGYEIRVITLEDTNDFHADMQAQGVKCYVWDKLSLREKWQILRWPDLIHGHLFPSIYIALAAFGKKRVQTEHATHNRRRDHIWMKPFEFYLYWRYQATVCITEQVQQALEDFLPQWKSHYQVILNGIDLSKYPLKVKSVPAADVPIRIGMVGRFHAYKDHPTLIRALALLPERYELHFAGDGDRRDEYQALVKSLALDSRVVFHGVRSDIPSFLNDMDVYVQSSIVEGFGLAAVEAMAAGLPVLASRVQGMREVIDNEASLFAVGDEKTLVQMIAALCDEEANYQVSAQHSISRCQHFTLSAFREQYYNTYQSLIGDKQRLADGKTS
ncbi:glycosyltransferase [Enterovibrio sp. 27052020O]|uniref:glycosyltransferase n=1 Tax=Enterovibrio sp. 27052020O TaxID=3241166 RepID=UPI00388F95B6